MTYVGLIGMMAYGRYVIKMKLYDNPAYTQQRVVNTIVRRTNGKAVIPRAISKANGVIADEMSSGNQIQFPYNELDLTPVPLGYVNRGAKGAIYIVRTPKRNDWKQGARAENLRFLFSREGLKPQKKLIRDLDDRLIEVEADPAVPIFRMPDPQQLANTIEGRFPSFDEAVALTRKNNEVAYNRNFSINLEGFIFHKGAHRIGKVVDFARRRIDLFDKYWWAREAYEESVA
jgi:hypothetical protein